MSEPFVCYGPLTCRLFQLPPEKPKNVFQQLRQSPNPKPAVRKPPMEKRHGCALWIGQLGQLGKSLAMSMEFDLWQIPWFLEQLKKGTATCSQTHLPCCQFCNFTPLRHKVFVQTRPNHNSSLGHKNLFTVVAPDLSITILRTPGSLPLHRSCREHPETVEN